MKTIKMTFKELGYIPYTKHEPFISKSCIFTEWDRLYIWHRHRILVYEKQLTQEGLSREQTVKIKLQIRALKAALHRLIKEHPSVAQNNLTS